MHRIIVEDAIEQGKLSPIYLVDNYSSRMYKTRSRPQTKMHKIFQPLIVQAKNAKTSVSRVLTYALKNVLPVIASLKLPDIQLANDIIVSGFTSIYDQVAKLVADALESIKQLVGTYTTNVAPNIKSTIEDNNRNIREKVVDEFALAINLVIDDVNEITKQELLDSDESMQKDLEVLINSIVGCLDLAEQNVNATVDKGVDEAVSVVIAALKDANEAVYAQIVALLADVENVTSIVPQLEFADSSGIAEYITSGSNAIYSNIEELLNNALADIENYLITASNTATVAEADLLNANYDAIVTAINLRVNDALVNIRKAIDEYGAVAVSKINEILVENFTGLSENVAIIVDNISPNVRVIVENETNSMMLELRDLISYGNASVVAQVETILAAA